MVDSDAYDPACRPSEPFNFCFESRGAWCHICFHSSYLPAQDEPVKYWCVQLTVRTPANLPKASLVEGPSGLSRVLL